MSSQQRARIISQTKRCLLRYLIREAGFQPQQRDTPYRHINREQLPDIDLKECVPLRELTVLMADQTGSDKSK